MRPNYPLLALTLLIGNRILNSRTRWGSADQPTSKKGAPPPPPQPEGTGKKRTPTSAFDPAASKDVYEPEKIIGQRLSKGVTTFNVKWVGWADKDNTWEPIEHLAGCEDMIAEFKEREKTRIAQLEAVAQAKHAEKAAAAAHALAHASAGAAAARLEAAGNDLRRSPRKEAERAVAVVPAVVVDSPAASGGQHDLGTKRSAPVWLPLTRRAHPLGRPAASCGRTTLLRTACAGRPSPLPAGRQRCGTTSSAVPSVRKCRKNARAQVPQERLHTGVLRFGVGIWLLSGCVVEFWQLPDSHNSFKTDS